MQSEKLTDWLHCKTTFERNSLIHQKLADEYCLTAKPLFQSFDSKLTQKNYQSSWWHRTNFGQ